MAIKKKSPNPFVLWCLGWLVPVYIRLIDRTTKWEIIGEEHYQDMLSREEGMITAFWHSRILMMIAVRRHYPRKYWFMISEHRDGEMIARSVNAFKIDLARGSASNPKKKAKNKSGTNAQRVLLKALKDKQGVGLTPDGPRGPRQRCHLGLIHLARLSGVPITPVAYAVKRAKYLSSWDRFHLPLPFSRGCYVYGKPITVTARGEEEMEQVRLHVEQVLNEVTEQADRLMGHEPVMPAAPRRAATLAANAGMVSGDVS